MKYKARLCVDGSQQEYGRDFWEVYAPVVSWQTIHLVLLLSTILNLKNRQVGTLGQHSDPKHHDKNHFIQLKRNLYGCKQAARNLFRHLTQGLLTEDFKQSKIDPCLFPWHDCIMVIYTDDCLIFSKDDKTIDNLLENLSNTYRLEDQGNVSDFLGIHITKDTTNKTISMSQPGLIDFVLQDLNLLSDSKTKDTPAMSILYPDTDGHP